MFGKNFHRSRGNLTRAKHHFCLRYKNGEIEVLIETEDGSLTFSDGQTLLDSKYMLSDNLPGQIVLRELQQLIDEPDLKEQELQDFLDLILN